VGGDKGEGDNELKNQSVHPHPNPLPSRERELLDFLRNHQISNVTQKGLELSLYGVLYNLTVGVKAFTSA
jgi:hypothetical protein